MNVLSINFLLAFVWTFLTGVFTFTTFLEGFLIGYLVLWMASPIYRTSSYFKKVRQVISFFIFFLWELTVASFRVAYMVIRPKLNMQPGIIAVPLDVKSSAEITLLANLITLTPGTLTLDVSHDREVIFVHVMNIVDADKFRRDIKTGFERRVGELLR